MKKAKQYEECCFKYTVGIIIQSLENMKNK